MPRRIFRLALLLSVTASVLMGQENLYTLKVDVPVVSVDVSVTDAGGAPVNSLSREDFEILEDGVPQRIQYFSPATSPYNVLLLFDKSGSIQHKWEFMQRATAAFIANLRPQDRIAIGTFGYDLQMHVGWTDDRRKAIASLRDLVRTDATGGTNLYDAMEQALDREFKGVTTRRAVVILTDGRDTSLYSQMVSRNRLPRTKDDREFQKAYKAARQRRIPIYFAAINTDLNLEPNTNSGDEYWRLKATFPHSPLADQFLTEVRSRMEQLANASGGGMLFPNKLDDIVPMYEQIGRELGVSYSLGYISSNLTGDNSFRRIEVRARTKNVRITQSRPGYSPR